MEKYCESPDMPCRSFAAAPQTSAAALLTLSWSRSLRILGRALSSSSSASMPHAREQEVSEAAGVAEGERWAAALLGADGTESDVELEGAFRRLAPGRRPDTVVLRGIPAKWIGQDGGAVETTSAPVCSGRLAPDRSSTLILRRSKAPNLHGGRSRSTPEQRGLHGSVFPAYLTPL